MNPVHKIVIILLVAGVIIGYAGFNSDPKYKPVISSLQGFNLELNTPENVGIMQAANCAGEKAAKRAMLNETVRIDLYFRGGQFIERKLKFLDVYIVKVGVINHVSGLCAIERVYTYRVEIGLDDCGNIEFLQIE